MFLQFLSNTRFDLRAEGTQPPRDAQVKINLLVFDLERSADPFACEMDGIALPRGGYTVLCSERGFDLSQCLSDGLPIFGGCVRKTKIRHIHLFVQSFSINQRSRLVFFRPRTGCGLIDPTTEKARICEREPMCSPILLISTNRASAANEAFEKRLCNPPTAGSRGESPLWGCGGKALAKQD